MDVGGLDAYHFLQFNEELLKDPAPLVKPLQQVAPVYGERIRQGARMNPLDSAVVDRESYCP